MIGSGSYVVLAIVVAIAGAVPLRVLTSSPGPPALGVAGTAAFLPLLFYRVSSTEPTTFRTVLVVAALVLSAELLYFTRAGLYERVRENLAR